MSPLSEYPNSPKRLADFISRYQFSPRKELGQNFLVDRNIINIIVKALCINESDSIFEIGTGMGALTAALLPVAKHVFSIEKDIRIKPALDEIFLSKKDNLTILYGDILSFDLVGFLREKKLNGFKIDKITGNLPYSISLPLLRKIMEMHRFLKMGVFMVQKEVGERILASPGNKNYGILSVMSQYYSRIEKIHLVKPGVFYPRPKVTSMIIRINFLEEPFVSVEDESLFFELVRAIFQHRRKNITNALKLYFGERIEIDMLKKTLQKLALEANQRGENLGLKELAQLTGEIKKIIK